MPPGLQNTLRSRQNHPWANEGSSLCFSVRVVLNLWQKTQPRSSLHVVPGVNGICTVGRSELNSPGNQE